MNVIKRLPHNVREVSEGIFLLRLPQPYYGHVNVYLLKGEGTNTLIDAGHPSNSADLIKTLRAMGCQPEELTQIIYTHSHVDHFGGGVKLTRSVGTTHIIHQDAMPDLRDYGSFLEKVRENISNRAEPFFAFYHDGGPMFTRKELDTYCSKYFPNVTGAPKLSPVEAGENIKAGALTLKVISTPGHSPYHVCLYDERRRILFSGDIVVGRSTSIQDVNAYMRTLQKLRVLKPALLLPGHGPARKQPGRVFISAMKDVQQKEKTLYKALRREPKTLPELASRLKRGRPLNLIEYLSIARWIFAFLEKFEREGRVIWEEKEGRVFYSLR